jgi:hypothetical protein
MRSVAATFARFLGLTVFLYAAWVFVASFANLVAGVAYDPLWTPWVILGIAVVGLSGSIAFLLSFDGPQRWRTRGRRSLGWFGMMFCALLPSQLIVIMAPLTAVGVFSMLIRPDQAKPRRGRHLIESR